MAIVVRTNIPILLDPIICHTLQSNLELRIFYGVDQEWSQVTAGGGTPADLRRK